MKNINAYTFQNNAFLKIEIANFKKSGLNLLQSYWSSRNRIVLHS